jgi:leucyl-tRNA synthetase
MFMGPLEHMKPWSMRGVEGVSRFLARVWRLLMTENQAGQWELSAKLKDVDPDRAQQKITHATIKKVTHDIESLRCLINIYEPTRPEPISDCVLWL